MLLADRVYVLTPRPARIAATMDVAIPRPRSLDSTAGPGFTAARASCWRPCAPRAGCQAQPGRAGAMKLPARRFLRNALPPATAVAALLLLWESYVDLTGIPRVICCPRPPPWARC